MYVISCLPSLMGKKRKGKKGWRSKKINILENTSTKLLQEERRASHQRKNNLNTKISLIFSPDYHPLGSREGKYRKAASSCNSQRLFFGVVGFLIWLLLFL